MAECKGGGTVSPTIATTSEICKIVERKNMIFIEVERNKTTLTEEEVKEGSYELNKEQPENIEDYLYKDFGIFKLTARECLRLQGVSDFDIDKMEKVNSKTQLLKQAGNSISVPVLMAIFSQLHIKGVPVWNDLTDEEKDKWIKDTIPVINK